MLLNALPSINAIVLIEYTSLYLNCSPYNFSVSMSYRFVFVSSDTLTLPPSNRFIRYNKSYDKSASRRGPMKSASRHFL